MRPWMGREEQEAAAEAIASGWVAQGPRVQAFEEAVGARVGTPHAVAVSSCTAALHLALVVAGIGSGDEVVVPSLSFIATANAPRYVGARPVFVDVEEATQNVTADTVAPALTPSTRAVIVVDQAGTPADVDGIRALCDPLGVTVVEDAACAIGSTRVGAPAGSRSEIAAFSFHARKVLTTGEGGMLVTSRGDYAARARRLREHGMSVSAAERHQSRQVVIEQYLETGFNYRMTDVQAAIGLVQLERLDAIVERRRHLAQRYQEALGDVPGLRMAVDPDGGRTNFQSFWVVLPEGAPDRDDVLRHMLSAGVSCRRGIMASHLEPAFAGDAHLPLPVTERLARRSLLLPLFHTMTHAEQDHVVGAFRRVLAPALA